VQAPAAFPHALSASSWWLAAIGAAVAVVAQALPRGKH